MKGWSLQTWKWFVVPSPCSLWTWLSRSSDKVCSDELDPDKLSAFHRVGLRSYMYSSPLERVLILHFISSSFVQHSQIILVSLHSSVHFSWICESHTLNLIGLRIWAEYSRQIFMVRWEESNSTLPATIPPFVSFISWLFHTQGDQIDMPL